MLPPIHHCGHCGHRLGPVPGDAPNYWCGSCGRSWPGFESGTTIRNCRCGQGVPMGLPFCWYCGTPKVRPSFAGEDKSLVGRIAWVLGMVASPPNPRDYPLPGDLAGTFDFWFDGGAANHPTGPTRDFHFLDGTRAWQSTKFGFGIHIRFPDGIEITVQRTGNAPGEEIDLD